MTPISALASIPPAELPARAAAPPAASGEERGLWDRMWGKEGFSFGALLDIVNPLQHIPVVSTIYRAITGDTIGPAPRIMGGALFGGIVGLIASAADSAVEAITGKDTGSQILAMLPEPDPVTPYTFADEKRGERSRMGVVMNVPDVPDGDTMLAWADAAPDTGETTPPAASAAEPGDVAPMANIVAASALDSAGQAHRPLYVPPRTAQFGAGGRQVPLTAPGHAGVIPANLPSPRDLAADPALLRDMRQGGAASMHKATGRIDTAIKGRGIVAPSGGADDATSAGTPTWLDYAARDPRAMAVDVGTGERGDNDAAKSVAPRTPSGIPEVGPDFLMKMQQALDKYQASRMSPAPSIDLSR